MCIQQIVSCLAGGCIIAQWLEPCSPLRHNADPSCESTVMPAYEYRRNEEDDCYYYKLVRVILDNTDRQRGAGECREDDERT